MNFAIIGASGNVGRKTIEILEKSKIPFQDLFLVASEKSAGKKIKFRKKEIIIENLENYEKSLDEKIAAIDLYLNYYYVNSEGLTLDISDEYVSNPINVYRMIDRLSHISDMTRKFIDGDAWDKPIRENVNKLVLANKELESEL